MTEDTSDGTRPDESTAAREAMDLVQNVVHSGGLRRSSVTAGAFWALLVLAFVAPAMSLVVTLRTVPDEVAALSPPVDTLVTEARQVEVTERHPASGELSWIDGPTIAAPSWSGLVTSVMISVGETVKAGTLLAQVDGVDRIAIASERPFYRALSAGDRGQDVTMLRDALADLGYEVEPVLDAEYLDWRVAAAIRRLGARLSHTDAAHQDGTFLPEWFGWLPTKTLKVHRIAMQAGRTAPAVDEPIVMAAPIPDHLSVTLASDDAQLEADNAYDFVVGDAVVPLTNGLTADGSDVASLAGQVRSGAEVVEGTVRLATERSAVVVPISAVLADPRGGHCVVLVEDGVYTPTSVVVAGGDIGTAEITDGLTVGTLLIANPAEVGLSCG